MQVAKLKRKNPKEYKRKFDDLVEVMKDFKEAMEKVFKDD